MNQFIERFNNIVKQYPENIAILVDGKQKITYDQLHQKAQQLALNFKEKSIKKGSLIALSIEKSPEYMIAILATWINHCAFLPLNPQLPISRKEYIIKEAKPTIIINQDFKIETQSFVSNFNPNVAYLIFTSGSTGKPKGVIINHDGITNFLDAQIKTFEINSQSRFLFYLSPNFDASISDIGVTLLTGATLCLETNNNLITTINLLNILKERRITHVDLPPSLLTVLNINQVSNCLETIIIGGEICQPQIVEKWANKFRLINVYGPTETTVCSSMKLLKSKEDHQNIGLPINNINYHIFNQNYQEVKQGETGELFISGIGLAQGYVNNPTLTKAKFITINNKRYYRTGDLVKQNIKEEYLFLGRIDRQFKINGQLVAPEEIEATLLQYSSIKRVAVILKQWENRKQIIAFVETENINNITPNILKYYLKSYLPSWMIPHHIFIQKKLPINLNGKIDYPALHLLEYKTNFLEKIEFNQEPLIKTIQEIWQKVLNLNEIPAINQDFFDDLGGDSIAVLKMIVMAESKGLYFPISILNDLPTIQDLAIWLKMKDLKLILSSDARSVEILKEEAKFNHNFKQLLKQAEIIPKAKTNNLFLTGVTGFLGIHILQELLTETNDNIICLIRAENQNQALTRIKNIANQYNIKLDEYEKRIFPLIGDLNLFQFGLEEKQWQNLTQKINSIYHCGGIVNMVKSYEELKLTNFKSTQEIIKLACTNTRKKVNFASSLSVFVATDQNQGICDENDCLENTKLVYGGYAQSKWTAEYFIHQLPKNMIDINIFRLGLLTGNSNTGKCSNHDYLMMFIRGLLEIASIPKVNYDNLTLDVTPVDYAAKTMVYLSLLPQSKCYHIANDQGFSLSMILDILAKKGYNIREISLNNWLKEVYNKGRENSSILNTYLALCRLIPEFQNFLRFRTMDLFQSTNIVFDQTNLKAGIKETKIICPCANQQLLEKYLKAIYND